MTGNPGINASTPILDVEIPLDGKLHAGRLGLPPNPIGLVLFAHGSGSSRLSPRNTLVAQTLQERGIATLLFDLLTAQGDRLTANRFDIALPVLGGITAPTLLIVGGLDLQVIEMNEAALQHLKGPKALRIIPSSTNLFEGPKTRKAVKAQLSTARCTCWRIRPNMEQGKHTFSTSMQKAEREWSQQGCDHPQAVCGSGWL